ncbi:MAG TPA: DUF3108 domain-containing protein [Pyrinomonadaceae bacterium]|nr:DUF3108 domain-containing protein [Pyrinomonadaceae bacterium]
MSIQKSLFNYLHDKFLKRKILSIFLLAASAIFVLALPFIFVSAQSSPVKIESPTNLFKVGEKITYNISFNKFDNIGYAELFVVSSGKLGDKNAVELHSKIKTNNMVSAAFYEIDETRVTFASAETGFPLYSKIIENLGVLPKETVKNYLVNPTSNYDLISMIYQIRRVGGNGNFSFSENDRFYNFALTTNGAEKLKTDGGEFETNVAAVQSDYLTENGIKDFRVNFSNDENKIPVLIRLKTIKGEFRASLASVQIIEPEIEVEATPQPIQTPRPQATPKPKPTPIPYQNNQPLLKELPFELGETLDFQISQTSQNIGTMRLQAKERKKFQNQDSLFLTASVTNSMSNSLFKTNDSIVANVNPDTLAPQQLEIKFNGSLSSLNQISTFDQQTGFITVNGTNRIESPVGTHNILSLIYAVRSFNLKPSKDPSNPVNDTRVAVFWDKQPYIFILRPSNAEIINLRGEKISAQMITLVTGIQQLDMQGIRIWLSNDDKRLPLRFTLGAFQADLLNETQITPK